MQDLNNAIELICVLGVVWIAAPAIVAYLKGYDWGWWLLTGGLIGVFVLAFLPRLSPNHPDASRWQAIARRAGLALTGLQFAVLIGFVCVTNARR